MKDLVLGATKSRLLVMNGKKKMFTRKPFIYSEGDRIRKLLVRRSEEGVIDKRLVDGDDALEASIVEGELGDRLRAVMPVYELTESHKAIARFVAMGWNREKIRKLTGCGDKIFSRLYKTLEWRELVREEGKRYMKCIADEVANNEAKAIVGLSARKAVDRLDQVLEGTDNDGNAIKAADIILKHAMPEKQSDGGGSIGLVLNITNSKVADLDRIELGLKKGAIDGQCRETTVEDIGTGISECTHSSMRGSDAPSDSEVGIESPRF